METVSHMARSMRRDGFSVVVGPDLPLLLEGPDILAAKDGRLVAVFTPNPREPGVTQRLLFRFALSRLALPSYAKCVLAVPMDLERRTLRIVQDNFHAVVPLENPQEFLSVVNDGHLGQHVNPIPPPLRTMHIRRTGFLDHLNRRSVELQTEGREANWTDIVPKLLRGWQQSPTNRQVFSEGSVTVAVSRKTRRYSLVSVIAPFIRETFDDSYSLHSGVPYFGNTTINVLLAKSITAPKHDPLKPYRAAAFAGWTVLQRPDLHDAEMALSRLFTWARRVNR